MNFFKPLWIGGLLIVLSDAAMAKCDFAPVRFHPPQNDSVASTGVVTGNGVCSRSFTSISLLKFTGIQIASNPSNGSLGTRGKDVWIYRAKSGFKGSDQFAVKICGTGPVGSGCSTITYSVTVQ